MNLNRLCQIRGERVGLKLSLIETSFQMSNFPDLNWPLDLGCQRNRDETNVVDRSTVPSILNRGYDVDSCGFSTRFCNRVFRLLWRGHLGPGSKPILTTAAAGQQERAVDTLRSYDFSQRFSVVSSSADGGAVHTALVWRHVAGLDDVHVVFPSRVGAGLQLFPSNHATTGAAPTMVAAYLSAAGRVDVIAGSARS